MDALNVRTDSFAVGPISKLLAKEFDIMKTRSMSSDVGERGGRGREVCRLTLERVGGEGKQCESKRS